MPSMWSFSRRAGLKRKEKPRGPGQSYALQPGLGVTGIFRSRSGRSFCLEAALPYRSMTAKLTLGCWVREGKLPSKVVQ